MSSRGNSVHIVVEWVNIQRQERPCGLLLTYKSEWVSSEENLVSMRICVWAVSISLTKPGVELNVTRILCISVRVTSWQYNISNQAAFLIITILIEHMLVLEVPYCLQDSLCLNPASSSTETNLRPGSQAPTTGSWMAARYCAAQSPDNDDIGRWN